MTEADTNSTIDYRELRQIIGGLDEAVILIDTSGRIIWANDAAVTVHGTTRVGALGGSAIEYRNRYLLRDQAGDELDARDYPIARLLTGATFSNQTLRITHRDADASGNGIAEHPRIVTASGMSVIPADDGPRLMVLIMTDITDRFEAEQRFERAFAANPAPALILRLHDSRYVKANDGFLAMTGFERDDLVGHPFRKHDLLRHAEQREQAIKALDEHTTIHQQESILTTRDGSEKYVILAGQPIMLNEHACMLFTFIDLDERKKSETELRHSEERFSKAFQLAPVPMLVCRREGWSVLEVNDAFTRTFDQPREAIIGKSAMQAGLRMTDTVLGEITAALDMEGRVHSREITLCTRDGALIEGLLSAESVTIQDDICILFVVQDISRRKRSEADLVAAIETVMKDTSWFSKTLMEKLAQIRHPNRSDTDLDMLTTREREVLELMCKAMNDADIAQSLGLSRNTVRNHVANIYAKIGVNRRSAAVVWGRERGLADY